MSIIKDMILTGLIGAGFGELLIRLSEGLRMPVPGHPSQRPVFLIGTILFSLVFRLFWTLREEEKTS